MDGSRHSERAGAQPIRTCVGCRSRQGQATLLRVVLREGQLAPDPGRRLPGRGAYIHPRRECLDRAIRRGGFSRSFRRSVLAGAVSPLEGALEVFGTSGLSPAHGDGK